jgi:lipopolysaccharide export system permease protein
MRLLDRYIAAEVARGTVLALIVLLAVIAFFTLVAELGAVGQGSYGVLQAMHYVAFTLPRRVYELLPSATLLGSMLSLGALAANSELVVIRAAGVSLARILWAVTKVGIVLMLFAVVMGEFIAPRSMAHAESQRAIAKTDQIALRTGHGVWARDGSSFVNIRRILPDGRIGEIYIYEFDREHRLRVATRAETGLYVQDIWLLEGIERSVIEDDGVTVLHAQDAAWVTLLSPELLNVVVVKPEQLSALDLRRYIGYLHDNGLNAARYEIAFWGKVISPLSNLVMLLVAIPFVFGSLRSSAAGQRIVIGVLVGIGFYLMNQIFGRVGQVYELNPLLTAALPALLFLSVALVAIRRVR